METDKKMDSEKLQSFSFDSLGTQWTIEIDKHWQGSLDGLKAQILSRLGAFDKDYSRFRADSLVTSMAQTAGTYTLPHDAEPMFDLYYALYQVTAGLLTPLIGQTLSDAGYDAAYSLKPKMLQKPPAWEATLRYKFPKLTLLEPALLDFGALGKGYAVDIVSELLNQTGVRNYCVNAGGDIRCSSSHNKLAFDIALEDPDNSGQAVGIAKLQDNSLCGSSGNRRNWGEYNHILNPKSLRSPKHIKALWVVADSTLLADGLSTALFFVPTEVLLQKYKFEYAIIGADNSLTYSKNFPAKFFT